MKKTTKLKQMLNSSELSFLMEAHSGLSAKIVEEAGFEGIWGSGLSISASLGVRDNNEASWTQILDVIEYMCDSTTIPVLLDGDSGYGNFNNLRRLVKKLIQRDAAGVCIEDKLFPKTNSFLRGEQQPLADIDEFCGKIKAGIDARTDDDFCIVARVEALIANWGLKEAIKRAEAYRQAGAMAILVHSKINTAAEIFAFMKEWSNRLPIVIVPTKYYSTPTQAFRDHQISTVIWANHLLRSSISAMQKTAKQIYDDQNLLKIEDEVASIQEIFRLQNDSELEEAEKAYLLAKPTKRAIILAASRGKELGELTKNKPKALIELKGKSLLQNIIDHLNAKGVNDITVVRGYKKEVFPDIGCHYRDNDDFKRSSELSSLNCAKDLIEGNLFIIYGDIYFRSFVLDLLEESQNPLTLLVDTDLSKRSAHYVGDYVYFEYKYELKINVLKSLSLKSKQELSEEPQAEWVGILYAKNEGTQIIRKALNELTALPTFSQMKIGDLINYLQARGVIIGIESIQGHWTDLDHYGDLETLRTET